LDYDNDNTKILSRATIKESALISSKSTWMHIFNSLRPQKLVERGDQLVLAALDLLASHGDQLNPSRRITVQNLLEQWVNLFNPGAVFKDVSPVSLITDEY
jgi:hypothetical protein